MFHAMRVMKKAVNKRNTSSWTSLAVKSKDEISYISLIVAMSATTFVLMNQSDDTKHISSISPFKTALCDTTSNKLKNIQSSLNNIQANLPKKASGNG